MDDGTNIPEPSGTPTLPSHRVVMERGSHNILKGPSGNSKVPVALRLVVAGVVEEGLGNPNLLDLQGISNRVAIEMFAYRVLIVELDKRLKVLGCRVVGSLEV